VALLTITDLNFFRRNSEATYSEKFLLLPLPESLSCSLIFFLPINSPLFTHYLVIYNVVTFMFNLLVGS